MASDECKDCHLKAVCFSDHINERTVCNAIAPEKDVDGFHIMNIGRLCLDLPSVIPATAAAVWEIIKRTGKTLNCTETLFILEDEWRIKSGVSSECRLSKGMGLIEEQTLRGLI